MTEAKKKKNVYERPANGLLLAASIVKCSKEKENTENFGRFFLVMFYAHEEQSAFIVLCVCVKKE